jgi:uncharacterized membrane protein
MDSISESNRSALAAGVPTEAVPATGAAAKTASARPRLDSLDWLRGLVMMLMVLDHTRDYLGAGGFNPRDVNDAPLFLTRWITHFCAPTFVFLAGISAHLYGARGRSRSELGRFLVTRGLWLIFLELVVIRFAWTFSLRMDVIVLQVIWAIGVSLLVLSGLIYLPRPLIASFAVLVIAGHNLLDGFTAAKMESFGWLWRLLHEQGMLNPGGRIAVLAIYPLVPWIAVLAAGYAFGPAVQAHAPERRRWSLGLGLALSCIFIVLRATNLYGDPLPWSPQGKPLATLFSFVNCQKYPPSLLFLCMTLGPAMLLLNAAEAFKGRFASIVIIFGRVPFFFYLAHIVLVHLMAVAWAQFHDGNSVWLFQGLPPMSKPPAFGLGLPMIYVSWLAALAMLYPLCRWFAQVKQRRHDWWLSYL